MDENSQNPKVEVNREQEIFSAALEQPTEERATFLKGACMGDDQLRQRVEALLEANDNPESLFGDLTADATHDNPFHDEAVGQTLGRYKLLERVGEGGYGVVYVAEQTEPVRRRVALKVIKLGMDTKQVVARFEAERQALALMDHPNIAKVLDAGTTDQGRPYFVMELVRGIKITEYCDQEKMNTNDRLDLFIKVCHAIQHAHQKGIIHRDIKPSNILVTLHDGVPIPKVIDFGIAKATEGRLTDATVYTQLHQFIGTPAYMSPEQAEMSGLDIDTRSDIYSLGVLLYELLIGKTPFDGKELVSMGIDAMRKTIRESEPARPSTRLATLFGEELSSTATRRSSEISTLTHLLKGDLDWIAMKCLEKDRQRRYETANALAADIKRHLHNEPIIARPPSTIYKFQKAWRRNKLVYSSGITVLLTLLLGICISLNQMSVAIKARDEAKKATEQKENEAKVAEEERNKAQKAQKKADEQSRKARLNLYAADMFAADNLIKEGNFGAAKMLLKRHVPEETLDDLRGYEWRYLVNRLRGDFTRLIARHPDTVSSLAMSQEDDQTLWAGDRSGNIIQWDLTSEPPSSRRQFQIDGLVYSLDVSPSGNMVAAWGRTEGENAIITFFTIAPESQNPVKKEEPGFGVAFSKDENRIAILRPDYRVELVYLDSGDSEEILPPLPTRFQAIEKTTPRISWSKDEQWIVTTAPYLTLRAKNMWTGEEVNMLAPDKAPPTYFLDRPYINTNESIITTAGMGGLDYWKLSNGSIKRLQKANNRNLTRLHPSPNDGRLVVGGYDHSIRILDGITHTELTRFYGHESEVWSVIFSNDGNRIYSGGQDRQILEWNADSTGTRRTWSIQSRFSARPIFSEDSQRMAIQQSDGHSVIIHLLSRLQQILPYKGKPLAFSADSKLLYVALQEETDEEIAYTGQLATISLNNTQKPITIKAMQSGAPDRIVPSHGKSFVGINYDNRFVALMDATSGEIVKQLPKFGENDSNVLISPNQKTVVYWSPGKEEMRDLNVFDVESSQLITQLPNDNLRATFQMKFSPDGKLLAAACADSLIRIWSTEDWQLAENGLLLGHKRGTFDIAFTPDGKTLASGNDDGTIKLWNIATGGLMASIDVGLVPVALVFSPDGNSLMVGCADGSSGWDQNEFRIFDVAPLESIYLEPEERYLKK